MILGTPTVKWSVSLKRQLQRQKDREWEKQRHAVLGKEAADKI